MPQIGRSAGPYRLHIVGHLIYFIGQRWRATLARSHKLVYAFKQREYHRRFALQRPHHMQRFTISLDDELAQRFDAFIAEKGYVNRSEAVRDMIRTRLASDKLGEPLRGAVASWCVANVSYVYDHHEQMVTTRVLNLQHNHHELVITSLHTHLDHDHCLETTVLRGPTAAVQACAEQLIALRGVRHGNIHLVPLEGDGQRHPQADRATSASHRHLKPMN